MTKESGVHWHFGSNEHCTEPFRQNSRVKVLMFGQASKTVNESKTRPIKHLYQAAFGRIEGQKVQTLILRCPLFTQLHNGTVSWDTHAFNQSHSRCEGIQVPDRPERIFKMVKEADAEHQIKAPELLHLWVFYIGGMKFNLGESFLGFFHVFMSAIERYHAESHRTQECGKVSDAAAHVQGRIQTRLLAQGWQNEAQQALAGLRKARGVRLIEDPRSIYGYPLILIVKELGTFKIPFH